MTSGVFVLVQGINTRNTSVQCLHKELLLTSSKSNFLSLVVTGAAILFSLELSVSGDPTFLVNRHK